MPFTHNGGEKYFKRKNILRVNYFKRKWIRNEIYKMKSRISHLKGR